MNDVNANAHAIFRHKSKTWTIKNEQITKNCHNEKLEAKFHEKRWRKKRYRAMICFDVCFFVSFGFKFVFEIFIVCARFAQHKIFVSLGIGVQISILLLCTEVKCLWWRRTYKLVENKNLLCDSCPMFPSPQRVSSEKCKRFSQNEPTLIWPKTSCWNQDCSTNQIWFPYSIFGRPEFFREWRIFSEQIFPVHLLWELRFTTRTQQQNGRQTD